MKKCRVKIWGSQLRCPVCQQDIFHFSRVKVAVRERADDGEIKYLFECVHCGHGTLFGGDMVADMESRLSGETHNEAVPQNTAAAGFVAAAEPS